MINQKKDIIIWLKKSKTLIEKIIEMVENNINSIDTIQQTLAAIWLLKSANTKLLENHLNTCCKNTTVCESHKTNIDNMMDELLKIFKTIQK